MNKYIPTFLLILIAGLLIFNSGCGRAKVDESLSAEEQWQIAKSHFEYEKYLDAIDILTTFTLSFSGSTLIDSAQFMLAEAHFALGEYILAASEYQRLVQNFPKSPLLDDAYLKIVLCDFYLSPRYELDQKYTNATLASIQDFQDQFAQTNVEILLKTRATTLAAMREVFTLGLWSAQRPPVEQAPLARTKVVFPHRHLGFGKWLLRVLTIGAYHPATPELKTPMSQSVEGKWIVQRALDEARSRLGKKDFKTAELYYRMKKYPSALIYLDTVRELYPETPWAQQATRMKGDCQFAMHLYEEAARTYQKYLDDYRAGDRDRIEARIAECRRLLQRALQPKPVEEAEPSHP